jgi:hypothetical protein
MAATSYAQDILLEQIDILPDAAPGGWTIEDGRVTQKDTSGSITTFTWTKPPIEIDEEGFSLLMTIHVTSNVKTRMEVSGSFVVDPPAVRLVETNSDAKRPHRATSSLKIRPPEIADAESICELRIEAHAAYGVTYRYRVVK